MTNRRIPGVSYGTNLLSILLHWFFIVHVFFYQFKRARALHKLQWLTAVLKGVLAPSLVERPKISTEDLLDFNFHGI